MIKFDQMADGKTKDAMPADGNNSFNQNERTLFVGGLVKDTNDYDIRAHFLTFGKIALINHKTDLFTGESRGFAFVTFKQKEDLEKAMAANEHHIKNTKVSIKKAQPKQGIVFVGKLPKDDELSDDAIKEFFSQFGVVDAVKRPYDKQKGGKKNFCFVYFQCSDSAKAVLSKGKVTIEKFEVEVGRATLKPSGDFGLPGLPHIPGMVGFGPANFAGYGAFPAYSTLPYAYGGMPYGYDPSNIPFGGYNPSMPIGYYGGVPGFISPRGRERGRAMRGRGGTRGQRTRPY